MPFLLFLTAALAAALVYVYARHLKLKREEYIRTFDLPRGLYEGLRKRRPELSLKECQLTAHALRQFFVAHLRSGRKYVSMPSQAADDLWHEFILYTRHYEKFCQAAFGRFLHHTPAAVIGVEKKSNEGLRRVWFYTCQQENINPRNPTRLPLLFALDSKLKIANGFHYSPDCRPLRAGDGTAANTGVIYCGSDFSSSSFDGSTDGFGDSSGGAGDSGGGDGGCGGGGCGGCGS
jgi:hypothetical protein